MVHLWTTYKKCIYFLVSSGDEPEERSTIACKMTGRKRQSSEEASTSNKRLKHSELGAATRAQGAVAVTGRTKEGVSAGLKWVGLDREVAPVHVAHGTVPGIGSTAGRSVLKKTNLRPNSGGDGKQKKQAQKQKKRVRFAGTVDLDSSVGSGEKESLLDDDLDSDEDWWMDSEEDWGTDSDDGGWKVMRMGGWKVMRMGGWKVMMMGGWKVMMMGGWKVIRMGGWKVRMVGWKVMRMVGWKVMRVRGLIVRMVGG